MPDHRPSAPFERAARGRKGYHTGDVERFLERARESYQSDRAMDRVTSADIRTTSFRLERGGFDITAVDRAFSRLEEAFAARERESVIADAGADTWVSAARADAEVLLARLNRPDRERFDRVPWIRSGYSIAEVDAVAARVARYFSRGDHLTTDQLRTAAFRTQRGGYREEQVDAALDEAVRLILAVR